MVLHHWDPTFGCFVIVEQISGLLVGTIGFFGPPDDGGGAMIGYVLVSAARGRGYATEALRALIQYAFAQPTVQIVRADPQPRVPIGNAPAACQRFS